MRPVSTILRDTFGPLGFHTLRGLERCLSPGGLYSLLAPLAGVRAAADGTEPPPSYFGGQRSIRKIHGAQVNYFLSRVLEFFPDRLGTAKWRDRFQTKGLHHIEQARKRGSRVVLVCFHFGTYKLVPFWLRSLGVPVIALLRGDSNQRSRSKRMKDERSPFPRMPTVLYSGNQLRQTVKHLSDGHVLLVAADRETSKQINVPLDDEWSFSMATGAMRLATRYDAELIPCCMTDEGRWNFRLEIGAPFPKHYLADQSDLQAAGEHLLKFMLPHLRRRPEACSSYLINRFQHNAPAPMAEHSFA